MAIDERGGYSLRLWKRQDRISLVVQSKCKGSLQKPFTQDKNTEYTEYTSQMSASS